MHTEVLTYQADGLSMHSPLYVPAVPSGRKPAVLVFPEAFGLSEHAKNNAQKIASLGYVALASDLHGEARQLAGMEQVGAFLGELLAAPERIRARARAGLAALTARPEVDPARVAAIGYCFGGTMAFELARGGAEIVAAVGFHSGLQTNAPAQPGSIRGKVLAMIGAEDPLVPPEQRAAFEQEMRAAQVDWQLHVYGGVYHSFTEPAADRRGNPALRYDARADARSWKSFTALLDEVFAS